MSILDTINELNQLDAEQEQQQQDINLVQAAVASALDYISEESAGLPAEALDIDQIDSALELVERAEESLALHLASFESAIADGGVTKQTFEAVVIAVQRDCAIVGHDFQILDTESLDKVGGRMEATELSAESIKASFQKAYKRAAAMFDSLIKAVVAFYKKHATQLGRFGKKSKTLSELAKNVAGTLPKDAKVTLAGDLFLGTKPATMSDLQKFVKDMQAFAKNKGTEKALTELAKAYSEAKVGNDAEALASAKEVTAKVNELADAIEESLDITKDTKEVDGKKLPDENEYDSVRCSEVMPGNFVVALGKPGAKTERMPSIKVIPTKDKLPKDKQEAALGKSDIQAYADMCSDLAAALVEISEGFDKKVADSLGTASDALVKKIKGADVSDASTESLQARAKQLRSLGKILREPGASLVTRGAAVGVAMYNVALKSAKMHKEEN